MKIKFWAAVHNGVAPPLMVVLPEAWGTWFHDQTARLAWGLERGGQPAPPFF